MSKPGANSGLIRQAPNQSGRSDGRSRPATRDPSTQPLRRRDTTMAEQSTVELRERVRARYAAAALEVTSGGHGSCCGDGCGCGCADSSDAGLGAGLYSVAERDGLPPEALEASLGCGNPHAVADLREGETVL